MKSFLYTETLSVLFVFHLHCAVLLVVSAFLFYFTCLQPNLLLSFSLFNFSSCSFSVPSASFCEQLYNSERSADKGSKVGLLLFGLGSYLIYFLFR